MTRRKSHTTPRRAKNRAKPRIKVGKVLQTFPAGTPIQVDRGPLPEGLVEKAAERAGFVPPPPLPDPDPYELATKHVTSRIGGLLVRACDQLSEEIASYTEAGGDDYMVRQALRTLWMCRWELGIGKVDGEALQYSLDQAVRRVRKDAEQAKEGAA